MNLNYGRRLSPEELMNQQKEEPTPKEEVTKTVTISEEEWERLNAMLSEMKALSAQIRRESVQMGNAGENYLTAMRRTAEEQKKAVVTAAKEQEMLTKETLQRMEKTFSEQAGRLSEKASERITKDIAGSDKTYTFRLIAEGKKDSVFVFESAIDLLSYATILNANGGDYKHENLLSVSGIYAPKGSYENTKVPVSLTDFLSKNPQVKKVFLCYDNDDKGRRGAAALGYVLGGRYEVKFTPPPDGSKDYNDYLMNLINDKKREVKANEDNRKNDAR